MSDPINSPTVDEDVIHDAPPPPRRSVRRKPREELEKRLIAERQQRAEERRANDLNQMLKSESGQAVIMRILCDCHIYKQSILTPEEQGQRLLGVKLIAEIHNLSPDSYPNLLVNHGRREQEIQDQEEEAAKIARSS